MGVNHRLQAMPAVGFPVAALAHLLCGTIFIAQYTYQVSSKLLDVPPGEQVSGNAVLYRFTIAPDIRSDHGQPGLHV